MPCCNVKRIPPITSRPADRVGRQLQRSKASKIPERGWTHAEFRRQRIELSKDLIAIRRAAMRENAPILTRKLVKLFDAQGNEVIDLFIDSLRMYQEKSIGSKLRTIVLDFIIPQAALSIWEVALNAVFGQAADEKVTKVFKPSVQSVMSHVTTKTRPLIVAPAHIKEEASPAVNPTRADDVTVVEIGLPKSDEQPRRISRPPTKPAQVEDMAKRKADELCQKVTRINETTRKRMRKFFEDNIEDNSTVGEMIKSMREQFPKIASNRIPTIVRNELSVAANEAQILSFQGSSVVTHCSVVGCQAIEDNSPTYKGFHTCNIRNVPVMEMQLVEFHINHTGSWIPSGFIKSDGKPPRLRLGNSKPPKASKPRRVRRG